MIKNKKILILGMARSGYEAAKLLSKYGNKITVTDMKNQDEEKLEELKKLNVKFIKSDDPSNLLDDVDLLIKNPGIRKDHKTVVIAKQKNIEVINEVEAAYRFLPSDITIVGITGSNGKTTTTTMIYDTIKKQTNKVHLAGNIGYPLSSIVLDVKSGDILIMEISDHQLLDMYKFKTNISVLTNLSEVHLDFHGDYESYKSIKKRIFNNHTISDIAIINQDNIDCKNITNDIKSMKKYFSTYNKTNSYLKDNYIYLNDKKIISLQDILIKGNHNYENIMCALLVLDELNIDITYLIDYLKSFKGVEHRIEFVCSKDNVLYYNDSKSTNVVSTITALKSFETDTLLILGGLDRGHSFDDLLPYMSNVKIVFAYGEVNKRIYDWCLKNNIKCIKNNTLKETISNIKENIKSGDVVLLSPACASWDQYESFEDRGNEFKELIK